MIMDLNPLPELQIGALVFIIQKKFLSPTIFYTLEHVGCLNRNQYGLITLLP